MTFRTDGTGKAESYVGGPVMFLSRDYMANRFELASSPIPAARAEVFFNARNGLWYHQITSEKLTGAYPVKSSLLASVDQYRQEALAKGSLVVTTYALMKWKEQFTGAQRYAMGHQRCPYINGCTRAPMVGSVWCAWHPFGRVRK